MTIKDAVNKIIEARLAYYYGTPIMSDKDFEKLENLIRKNDPTNPVLVMIGAPVPGKQKVKHRIPMGSLANAKNTDDIKKWYKCVPEGTSVCAEHKLDGASLELIYENGQFIQAITRGDGFEGEDVTQNVLMSKSIPFIIDEPFTGSVKAECVIRKKAFAKYFHNYSNTRNAASGVLRASNESLAKYLYVIAYGMDITIDKFKTEFSQIQFLHECGFHVTPVFKTKKKKKIVDYYLQMEQTRDDLAYEIDGIVLKIDDVKTSKRLGEVSDLIPKGQIAAKFTPRGNVTTIQDVQWSVGHTGALTPVAKVRPVAVGGTIIENVTLHNMDEIKRLGVKIGDSVEVVRAGDVIPKIVAVTNRGDKRREIETPKNCPSCSKALIRDGAFLRCINSSCPAMRIRKIQHWINEQKIMFIGDSIVNALWNCKKITCISDLYQLTLKDLSLLKLENKDLGRLRAKKILEEIDKTRTMSLIQFLSGIGIPNLGKTVIRTIVKDLGLTSLVEFIYAAQENHLSSVQGVGESRELSAIDFIDENLEMMYDLEKYVTIKENKSKCLLLDNLKFCFTGAATVPREKLFAIAEENGGIVKSSVTKDTDYLVMADPNSNSTKAQKAKKYGTKVISETEFLNMAKWDGSF